MTNTFHPDLRQFIPNLIVYSLQTTNFIRASTDQPFFREIKLSHVDDQINRRQGGKNGKRKKGRRGKEKEEERAREDRKECL